MTNIVITITVKEPKGKGRPIIVSAAPSGEMPLMVTGQFADRHQLLDSIFAQLLTRKPQVVKVAADKKVAPGQVKSRELAAAKAEPAATEEPKPDQLVRQEPLSIIEGDEPGPEAAGDGDNDSEPDENEAIDESDALDAQEEE